MRKIEAVQEHIEDILTQYGVEQDELLYTESRIDEHICLFIIPRDWDKMVVVRFNVYNGPGNDRFDVMVLLNLGGVTEADFEQDLMVSCEKDTKLGAAEAAVEYLTKIFNGE